MRVLPFILVAVLVAGGCLFWVHAQRSDESSTRACRPDHLDAAIACARAYADGPMLWVEADADSLISVGPEAATEWSFGFEHGGQVRFVTYTTHDGAGWATRDGTLAHPFQRSLSERTLAALRDLPANRSISDNAMQASWTLGDWGYGARWMVHATTDFGRDTYWQVDPATGRDVLPAEGAMDNPFRALSSSEAIAIARSFSGPRGGNDSVVLAAEARETPQGSVQQWATGAVWVPADDPMGNGRAPMWGILLRGGPAGATFVTVRAHGTRAEDRTDEYVGNVTSDPMDSVAAVRLERQHHCAWSATTYETSEAGWELRRERDVVHVGRDGTVDCHFTRNA